MTNSFKVTERYTLTPDNYPMLQGEVLARQHLLKKTLGLSGSRAAIQAEDEIARDNIEPACTGPELSKWMAERRNSYRKAVYGNTEEATLPKWLDSVADPVQEVEITAARDVDTFNQGLTGKDGRVDPMLAALIEKCRQIKVGEVWSFPANSEKEVRLLSDLMPKVSKQLGWRLGAKRHSYLHQIYPDRLKIKRLT